MLKLHDFCNRAVEGFFDLVAMEIDEASAGSDLIVAAKTRDALLLLREATKVLHGASIDQGGAAAVDYLRLFALVALGWMWTRMAVAAKKGTSPLHHAKLCVADFFAQRVLPQAQGLAVSIAAGERPVMALPSEAF